MPSYLEAIFVGVGKPTLPEIHNMRRTLFLILAIGIATTAGSLRAQNPGRPSPGQLPAANGEVRGSVVDENNAPVARATITVRSKRDSSLVAGAIATTEGAFNIQGLRPGAYYLRVTSIGFGPRIQELTIADASARASLGISSSPVSPLRSRAST